MSDFFFALGFLLSPEQARLAGQAAGLSGAGFIAALLCSGLGAAGAATALAGLKGTGAERFMNAGLIAVRFTLFCFFGTLLSVTAGYTFNEVFAYWFPNLLFSFLLLCGCALLCLTAGQRLLRRAQVVLCGIAVAGILVLSAAALGAEPVGAAQQVGHSFFSARGWLLAALLFLGFDLAEGGGRRAMLGAVGALFLLWLIWGAASLHVVGPDRLSNSTVAHMVAARTILGEPGRWIMGAAMLSASAAALIALLHGFGNAALRLAGRREGGGSVRSRLPMLAPWLGAAALLALGYGGEPVTQSLLLGAAGAYFCLYGAACLLFLIRHGPAWLSLWGLITGAISSIGIIAYSPAFPESLGTLGGTALLALVAALLPRGAPWLGKG